DQRRWQVGERPVKIRRSRQLDQLSDGLVHEGGDADGDQRLDERTALVDLECQGVSGLKLIAGLIPLAGGSVNLGPGRERVGGHAKGAQRRKDEAEISQLTIWPIPIALLHAGDLVVSSQVVLPLVGQEKDAVFVEFLWRDLEPLARAWPLGAAGAVGER